jgi:hypothetical protein
MRIGIVACEVLKDEIEFLTKDDPDFVHRDYLKFALHEHAEEMKKLIIEKVNALHSEVDAVLLGYATCQSLQGVTDVFKVPAVMLPGADCIEVLLSPDGVKEEKKKCVFTWFASPGWAVQGVPGLIEQFHLDSAEGYEPQYFLDLMFESYQRCLFINSGIGNDEFYHQKAKDMADGLKLKLDTRSGSLERIKECIVQVKELARSVEK